MPSQAADELWHEFILHTREYAAFCRKAFGRMLHHTPATALTGNRKHNAGLRRVWYHACREDLIDPRNAIRLPLLFALDAKLMIPDGFRYALDCHGLAPQDPRSADAGGHCAGDFSDASIDGGTEGMDGADGSGSDAGGGDGGGGDSGCGGGGCGGGD
jgi:hypothetical protein